jgi:hypothetical protein
MNQKERGEILVEKAHKKWGDKHSAFCQLCHSETESVLMISLYYETAYLKCRVCNIARSPLETVTYM